MKMSENSTNEIVGGIKKSNYQITKIIDPMLCIAAPKSQTIKNA
jgi:hypothetical protein